eukprot:TRINITY_DN5196_c0_g3_i6.p1 TRINITY_DN5196_c0_g3~~TRINITY_DN5196_c0_g3_i6.p1  ORF type:complete len:117 (-),score=23.52 TRINITY_DN5196_c0_g3_i6:846-1196(-)
MISNVPANADSSEEESGTSSQIQPIANPSETQTVHHTPTDVLPLTTNEDVTGTKKPKRVLGKNQNYSKKKFGPGSAVTNWIYSLGLPQPIADKYLQLFGEEEVYTLRFGDKEDRCS